MELMKPKIKINKLVKKFGIFTALDSINVEIYPDEIHALLGDNGAGKSTLIKILSGIYPSTSGEILIDDKVVNFRNPHDASLEGIGTVYQDLALVPSMSLSRNFFMGRELTKGPKSLGVLDKTEMNKIAKEEMIKIGINVRDAEQSVDTMSGVQRQTLAIARAIYFGAKILILDEPTSALGQKQQLEVLKTIMRVRALGNITIIFISHNEVHSRLIADRYTFLSLGKIIGGGTKDEMEGSDIRQLMAGGAKLSDMEQEIKELKSKL